MAISDITNNTQTLLSATYDTTSLQQGLMKDALIQSQYASALGGTPDTNISLVLKEKGSLYSEI